MVDTTDTEDSVVDDVGDDWGAALAEQADAEAEVTDEASTPAAPVEQPQVEKAELPDFQQGGLGAGLDDVNMDVILDVPVTISMEIGRTNINIRNLLQLNQGSVVELDRLAGEPMDVLVNGTLIAHGEVVVVNDKFGIRLTDVISAAERIKKLR